MAWNSFLKNILGSGDDSDDIATLPDDGSPRNLNLSGGQFKQQLLDAASAAALLDVRTSAEFGSGTIPGARNIDFFSPNFQQKISQLDKGKTYFVFCRSGNRSGQACKMMHKLGFDVRNLSGGIGAFPG